MGFLKLSDSIQKEKFYVYVYYDVRPGKEGTPIYVGKGKNDRAFIHIHKKSSNRILRSFLKKIADAGLLPDIRIIQYFDDESSAFLLEIDLIRKYGRIDQKTGTLANLTCGGDGVSGISGESLERKRASHRAMWNKSEYRERITEVINDRWSDPKFKDKMRSIQSESQGRPDVRRRRSEISKCMWQSSEHREKFSRIMREKYKDDDVRQETYATFKTEEYRKSRSELAKELWKDPVKRANMIAGQKKHKKEHGISEETRRKLSEASKRKWSDPELAEKMNSHKRKPRKDA